VNPDAGGIDVGSREHYVAVPPDRCEETVRVFGCTTPALMELAAWLKTCGVKTVAMESTGVYWVPVAQVLEGEGIVVHLVNAGHVKNVPGRKSDVIDCQWLQEMHTFGLLRGAHRPAKEVAVLRGYWRHRETLVEEVSRQILRMQKALEQMNLQLHKVLSDVSGVSGMAIIRAILAGERDGRRLATLANYRVKSTPDELAAALTGEWREEQLFILRQSVELYETFQEKITVCEGQVEAYLKRMTPKTALRQPEPSPRKAARRNSKNAPDFDLHGMQVRLAGVDLTLIDGIDVLTAQVIYSEIGFDISAFPSEKNFSSWLGLCPNNKITGGKVKSSRTKSVASRVATALRQAAFTLHHSRSWLGAFYRKMRTRLGPAGAITASAHKLAVQVYRMLKYGGSYDDKGHEAFEKNEKEREMPDHKLL